ncbi:lysophospholipase [Streptomyces sp. J2-1]|uniref:alpha/beta hydrolase n=1 Tax=Streptomyces corallincola TaxID=2851888 RepID=UPI001C37E7C2|nr:alpha/beta hydrolase [Streptomyces corallincola]MBV2355281.1 lysophospholipase [Streptomyces corallincola]
MPDPREHRLGRITAYEWPHPAPRYLALLVHGYGEHAGRHAGVAEVLHGHGAAVYAPDHTGHGKSDGERVVIEDFEEVVADVHRVSERARTAHPGLPLLMVGHSMGGLIASRYAQRYPDELSALVLSGPVIGAWELPVRLLALDEIPDVPINPAALSRDPVVGAAYAADPLVWHGPMKRPTLLAFTHTLERIAEEGEVPALPMLWLHGSDDRLVPIDGSRPGVARLSGGRAVERVFPGARHEVFLETNREEAFAELLDFVDSVLPRSGNPADPSPTSSPRP